MNNGYLTISEQNDGEVKAVLTPSSQASSAYVTTDDLPTGQPAATPRSGRGAIRFLSVLCLASLASPLWAQTAELPVASSDVVAPIAVAPDSVTNNAKDAAKPATAGIREKAAEAATATLAALLPRLAATDTLPLLDRSTMVAGDLSRLLSSYAQAREGTVMVEAEGGKIQAVLKRALTLMGTPYRWGGTSPDSGFDCSGLVGYVFRSALGIELPRVSRDMASQSDGEMIAKREDLKQGDLVFFGRKGRINHVGIYVGEGRFLHSPSTGNDVRVDSLTSGYWAPRFMQARRIAM